MRLAKKLAKQYFGFLLGLILGSVVATLTTYTFFVFYYGEIPNVSVEDIQEFQECLIDEY